MARVEDSHSRLLVPLYLRRRARRQQLDEDGVNVYGIEMHITGPEFMNLKESMHEEYEVMRIDKATGEFLDQRPFQMGNLEVLVAFLRAMDKKNGDGEEFLRISKLEAMMETRERLYASTRKKGSTLR